MKTCDTCGTDISHIANLQALLDASERAQVTLQRRIAELEAKEIHTCHDKCPRIECVQRREIERFRRALELIAATANGANYKVARKALEETK